MSLYYAKSGVSLFQEGNHPGVFFILRQGTCELSVEGKVKKTLQKGDCVGDKALIYGTFRECTATTSTQCFFWTMEKRNFKKIIEHITHITYEDTSNGLRDLPFFSVIALRVG